MTAKRHLSHAARPDRRPRIFISYRRSDSAAIVGHIYERLVARYKKDGVFRDINKMPLGKNFYDHIKEELAGCDVVLAIVGPQWLAADGKGHSRIHDVDDPVRMEIEAALQSGATIIPVLVEGSAMAKAADLPETLRDFPSLAGTRINVEDFDTHIERLIQSIDEILERRGKYVVSFPSWAPRMAACCGLAAVVALISLVTLMLLGRAPSPDLGLLGVATISLGFALACAFAGGDAVAKHRIPIGFCQKRPVAFSAASGVVAFLLLLSAGAFLTPSVGHQALVDPVSLANELRTAFHRARDNLEKSGIADFRRAEALIDALKGLDEQSGHAWYFSGEIKRIQNREYFTLKSCFKGWPADQVGSLETYQQDFHRYLETALSLPILETGGSTGSDTCYRRSKGYCVQRTTWIYHLLANDFYLHAAALADRRDRAAALTRASRFVTEARKYRPLEGGDGFDQCIHTTPLAEKIGEDLQADRVPGPPGRMQSLAQ